MPAVYSTHALSCSALAVASVKPGDAASSTEVVGKVVPRLTLYGALPPSILPVLLSIRTLLDLPKTGDRKLLRIVNYLIQLACGDGSAGTVVPFSPLVGELAEMLWQIPDRSCKRN